MAAKKYLYIHENIFVQIANGMSVKFTDGLYVYININVSIHISLERIHYSMNL